MSVLKASLECVRDDVRRKQHTSRMDIQKPALCALGDCQFRVGGRPDWTLSRLGNYRLWNPLTPSCSPTLGAASLSMSGRYPPSRIQAACIFCVV